MHDLRVLSYSEDCKDEYVGETIHVTDGTVCTNTTDPDKYGFPGICEGDGGGALVSYDGDIQVGIASFVMGCGWPGSPSVYTAVGPYLQWIRETMDAVDNPPTTTMP